MSLRDAAGWSRSRSHSVSVVPMIQWAPHGITNRTLLLGAQDQRRLGRDPVARHQQVDALRRAHLDRLRDPGELLQLAAPHAGRVDDDARAQRRGARPRSVSCSAAWRSPSAPSARPSTAHAGDRQRAVGDGRAHQRRRRSARRRCARRGSGSPRQRVGPQRRRQLQRGAAREVPVARHRGVQAGQRVVERRRRRRRRRAPRCGGAAGTGTAPARTRCGRERRQQQRALVQRLAHEREVALLEVAQAAVDQLARATRGAGARSRASRPARRCRPRVAASSATPAPVTPPPTTSTSNASRSPAARSRRPAPRGRAARRAQAVAHRASGARRARPPVEVQLEGVGDVPLGREHHRVAVAVEVDLVDVQQRCPSLDLEQLREAALRRRPAPAARSRCAPRARSPPARGRARRRAARRSAPA